MHAGSWVVVTHDIVYLLMRTVTVTWTDWTSVHVKYRRNPSAVCWVTIWSQFCFGLWNSKTRRLVITSGCYDAFYEYVLSLFLREEVWRGHRFVLYCIKGSPVFKLYAVPPRVYKVLGNVNFKLIPSWKECFYFRNCFVYN